MRNLKDYRRWRICSPGVIAWVWDALEKEAPLGDVLEVGSYNVNGSVRPYVEPHSTSYLGVDIKAGPGVDEVMDAEDLWLILGPCKFDTVISTEMVEHVRDWRKVMWNMAAVLKVNGILVISTRSEGFPMHGYPEDHWRYSVEDMARIFDGWGAQVVHDGTDPGGPGVFLFARKPQGWDNLNPISPLHWDDIHLYSMEKGKRDDS